MTTIFSAGQAFLACEAGVKIIFPYVNRSTRLLGDGLALVRQMRTVIDGLKSPVQILAASIKSPAEAVDTIIAGAHGLTLPLDVMLALGEHPYSLQAIAEFAISWGQFRIFDRRLYMPLCSRSMKGVSKVLICLENNNAFISQ